MTEKNYNFQKLTPTNNTDLKIYNDAINFVFSNDDIKNVAISGAYGAGKSSVLETYKASNRNIRFIHISLAHFESTTQNGNDTSGYNKSILEGKILNQLIHQIDPQNIPRTQFKVKQRVSSDMIRKNAAITMVLLMLAAYILNFNNWRQFVSTLSQPWPYKLLSFTTNSISLLISGAICATILGMAVYAIINTQKYKNMFRKVNLHVTEIEIFEETKDESYFDKYLNEVLYLFENSGADVIVFEDMDRYNVNLVFEKLREINTLVNCKKNKPIRFFYLLRDDIFVSKDRTKFFDFIIPIVPVIDGSNSYDQFIEHFRKGGIFELFDESFLQGLSLYVDDMRILKNIYNEFIIYHNRIQSTELKPNKLLAMITYKNIFPKDFSDLQLGLGFVHTIFVSKPDIIKKEIQNIEAHIKKIEEDISSTEKEQFNSIDELDTIFLKINQSISEVAGTYESNFNSPVELIKAINKNPDKVYYIDNYNRRQKVDLTSAFEQLLQNPEYLSRKEAIERKKNNQIEELKAEIQKLQKEKSRIQNNRLRDIINKDNINAIFSIIFSNEISEANHFKEIKASPYFPLIKYLIRNGYIDETYPDYMTYFYGNSLSPIDKIFLRSITDETPKEYSYSLKDPQTVLSRLRVDDFDHEEILNFDLLCYLLETKQNNQTYLTQFIGQLIRTKNYRFIGEFLGTQRKNDLFVETINHLWPSIFQDIINESNFSHEQKKQYAIDTLYFSPEEDIWTLNENRYISQFISKSPDFLNIDSPNVNKLIAGFSLTYVKFSWIDYSVSNKELFDAVYKNNQYQLTFELISLMLEKIYHLTKSEDFKNKNYTLVASKPDEPLLSYITQNYNINNYIDIVLNNCDKCITDEESAALAIINNNDVSIERKEKYISFLHTILERIDTVISKELWSLLLKQKRVKYTEDNILSYFFHSEKGLDSFLVQFINEDNNDLNFDYDTIDMRFGDSLAENFFTAIVTCNQLANKKYETILLSLERSFESFPFKEVAGEKVAILIKLGVIKMTDENLTFMRDNYLDQLMQFITKNISQYIYEVIKEKNFNFNEMLSVLDENVADQYKIDLLQKTSNKISLHQKKYSDAVKMHILEHNLDENDLPFLLNAYPHENIKIKEIILRLSVQSITGIITYKYPISFELLSELLADKGLTEESKKELFKVYLPKMDETQAKSCLRILQMDDFLSLFERKHPKFEINPLTEQILSIFKEKNWITSFDIDNEDSSYYRVSWRENNEEQI